MLALSATGASSSTVQSKQADDAADLLVDQLLVRPISPESGLSTDQGVLDKPEFEIVELNTPVSLTEAEELADDLVAAGVVAAAEPDGWRQIASTTNDPYFGDQWSLESADPTRFGIGVVEAWDVTLGSGSVTLAVIDTGSLPHPDIDGRLVAGWDFVSEPWMSNDGDGWDADPTDSGDPCDGKPSTWHGLHTAGISGAEGDNSIGIAGIDRGSRVQPVRVIGSCGGRVSDVAAGIRWAAGAPIDGAPPNPTPARVINVSLGGVSHCSMIEQSAIDDAVDRGSVVVVAAGNRNRSLADEPYSPAVCNNVIAVAATTRFGDRADYSNYGPIVDIAAPGGLKFTAETDGILSLSNAGTVTADLSPSGWTYAFKQGTSMAAPHVSGVVSLMLAVNGSLSPAQVEQILKQTARPFPTSPRGSEFTCSSDPTASYYCGAGLLDAGSAVRAAAALVSTPAAPEGVTVSTSRGAAQVSWTAPNDGGSPIEGYVATAEPGGRTCTWVVGPLTCVIDGLESGRQYTVSVVAQNRKGVGPPALSAPFTWWPTYNAVAAARLFDTRLGSAGGLVGVAAGRVVPGSPLSVGLVGVGGVPVSGVGGLSLNVTVTGALAPGFVTVFGCGGAVPWVSSVNFGVGESVANAVVVPPGVGGRVCFDASVPVHVIADVNGWFAQGEGFNAVAAARLFDTRLGSAGGLVGVAAGRVVPGSPLSVGLVGVGGVPVSGVGGLSLNVTVTGALAPGFVTVFGCGGAVPWVSSVNFGVGESVANAVVVPPGVGGRVCFDASVPVHVIADVNGWFAQGEGFNAVAAARLFDTRLGSAGGLVGVAAGRVVPGSPLSVGLVGVGGVPVSGVGGLSLNVTVTGALAPGFVTVFGCGGAVPWVSSVNFGVGESVANAVVVPPGVGGRVCFDASVPVHVIADVNGWFDSSDPVR